MLVVDASAVVEFLLARPLASDIARHLEEHDFDLHAPHLLDLEVTSALRRLVGAGHASPALAGDAIDDLLGLPIERHAHDVLLPRVWQLRATITAYDASYLALAESLGDSGCPVITTDRAFAQAVAATSDVEALLVA